MKKYYTLVFMFTFGMMGVFVLLGSKGTIPAFVAFSGILATVTGGIGTVIHMNDK